MSLLSLSAEELAERAAALEARLPTTSPLALLAPNGISALLGRRLANTLGVPLVPINPLLRPAEIQHILGDCQAEVVLVDPSLRERAEEALEPGGPRLLTLDCEPLREGEALLLSSEARGPIEEEDIGSTLIYTSGTTGRPKGCLRSAAQETARARELVDSYAIGPEDTQLIACPLAHSAPGIFVRAGQAVGASALILPRFTTESFWTRWHEQRCSFFFLVPTQYQRLLNAHAQDPVPGFLRRAIVAGSPLRERLQAALEQWLGPNRLYQFFGSSETGTISVAPPGGGPEQGVGRPVEGVEVQVRAEDNSLCAAGELGELYIRSPMVMSGYWPSAQLEDADGFVSVGDLGYLDALGNVHLVDRKHDTIITGGVNVYPAEVEAALLAHPEVEAAVVVGVEDEDWGQRVVALVACNAELELESLRDHCRAQLAPYKVPKELHRYSLEQMPVGASGKPMRRAAHALLRQDA